MKAWLMFRQNVFAFKYGVQSDYIQQSQVYFEWVES